MESDEFIYFLVAHFKRQAYISVFEAMFRVEERVSRTSKAKLENSHQFFPHWDSSDDFLDHENDSGRNLRHIKKEKNVFRFKKDKRDSWTDWAGSESQEGTTDHHSSSDSDAESKKRGTRGKKITLKFIRPGNTLYSRALDYRTYRLDDKSTRFDSHVSLHVSKMDHRM